MPSVNKAIEIAIAVCPPDLKHSLSTAALNSTPWTVSSSSRTHVDMVIEQNLQTVDPERTLFFFLFFFNIETFMLSAS